MKSLEQTAKDLALDTSNTAVKLAAEAQKTATDLASKTSETTTRIETNRNVLFSDFPVIKA